VWYPATDVYQTEDGFVVRMELSGVRRDDLQIVMQGNLLEVRGLRRSGLPPGRKRFHNLEIAMGPFLRQLKVPTEFAQGEAKASYNDGILEIKLGGKMKRKGGVVRIELVGGGE
ncbi:MAG: Hsp20/alpha crystallin family protein, partial [Candidatus Eisenbacteria bacterium]|nr:Hsp20/alpha crystallin family protein [Candidatus Eisenbacteria bacterium]